MGASEKTERGFVRDRSPTPDWVIRKSPSKAPGGILSPNSRVNKPPTRTKHDLKVAARDTNEVELENLQILKLYLQKADSLQKLGHLFSRGEPQTKKLAKTWLASLEDKQLFTELGCQDSCGSTPLIEAVKYRNAELLETYLSRLKEANKKFPGYFSNTLKLHDVAQHTCLTYAMKFYHSVRQEGSLTEAGIAELVLQFCTDVPELLMHQGRKGFTALHILIGHLPNCIRNKETKILSLSEKMVKICPDLLTLTITITPNDVESRELTAIPETPYIFLQRLLKESGIARGQLGAEEKLLDKLMDRIKCVWMRNGYEVGVLYRPGLEPTFALDLTEYSNYQIPYRYLDYFRRSEFENVLRLVSIPAGLEILHSPCNAPCRESACNHGTKEKVKLEAVRAIFHWLKGFNLVRKVLQVNVDDWGHGCVCMDKLIETVLWSYEVEVFNWRRVNITIDTIWKATPDRSNAVEETARDSSYPSSIRKLYLYWAGRHRHRLEDWANQATWELAPQHFPKLESVHITLCMDEEERRHRQPQRISEVHNTSGIRHGSEKFRAV
ncbi:hypothetical protein BGX38DRAFT_334695 [Terfezia claveryi]|nr:hypothetical protein BGX38DRAFT_334695 [Terfezia claveryi]